MGARLRLWLGLFLLFAALAHGNLESTDSAFTLHAARALWLRGDAGLRGPGQDPQWAAEAGIAEHIAGTGGQYGMVGRNGLHYVWFPMGHVWCMVPAVAAGEALAAAFPGVERSYRERVAPGVADAELLASLYPHGQFVFGHALAALLPAAFGAGSALLLLLLAQALGCGRREALLCAGAVVFGSQFFPLTRETLSDGPGMFFLLAALLGVVRHHQGELGRAGLLWTGAAAGGAVLTRYPHALLVAVLGLAIAATALRRRRPTDVAWFALGGLPLLLLFCTVNWLRFGRIGETGYGNSALAQWFNYPFWLGLPKILVAAGKGILWFTPLLWLALPLAFGAAVRGPLRLLALVLFALPVLMFSNTLGWQSGQCWGIRYVTPGVVALLAIVLPLARPWRSHPRAFALLLALGVLVNVTGVVAPTRGHNQLAGQATEAFYRHQFQRGEIGAVDLANLDPADHFFFLPRFSPLHSHWTYAWLSGTGEFEDAAGRPRHGAEHTIRPMFGVDAAGLRPFPGRMDPAVMEQAPIHWEDRCGRHLWWRFWADLLGIHALWLLLPVLALAGLLLLPALRRLSRN